MEQNSDNPKKPALTPSNVNPPEPTRVKGSKPPLGISSTKINSDVEKFKKKS